MAPNPLLNILARGGINPGIIAGTAVAEEETAKKHPTTKKGAIIGIIIGGVCLLILIVWAVIASRRSKNKKARGTKISEVGGTYEEVRPLATEGYPMVVGGGGSGQPPMVMQPGVSFQSAQGYGYPPAQGGYPPQGLHGQELGQQGTQFYRNQ